MRRIIAISIFCSFHWFGFSQETHLREISLEEIETLYDKYGADSVSDWIGGLPIWLLNEQTAIDFATRPDPHGDLIYFVKKLGQNLVDDKVASKLESLYQNWFSEVQKIDFSEELIPIQDDRLMLSLLNQTSLDRKKNLENELALLKNLRDSIRSNQPDFFKKVSLFSNGGVPITENKRRIEHAILKTYYQLNQIDSINYSDSDLKKQARRIESWQRPYRPERFEDKVKLYYHTVTEIKASSISEVEIKKIRNIASYIEPPEGMKSRLTKITSDKAMILTYGIYDGVFGGWGESILVWINVDGLVEYHVITQWI